jgi:tight adherence protein B
VTVLLASVLLAVLLWPVPGVTARVGGAEGAPKGASTPGGHRRRHRVPRLRRPGPEADAWVADLAEVVVVGLDAGLDLHRAVLAAARAPTVAEQAPWLERRVLDAVESGAPVSTCLGEDGEGGDGPTCGWAPEVAPDRRTTSGLGVLVRAWRLSEEVGATASATTAAAAASLRARHADQRRATALAAGPRASMRLLASLPLLGPVAGLLLGVGPGPLYGSTAAQVSVVAGVLVTLPGWAWARAVLRRAGRPATTSGPAP